MIGRYRIGKQFRFEAAHSLPNLPEGHKCSRLHGHSYRVELSLLTSAELVPPGFVVDFAELTPLRAYIDAHLDHRNLDDVLDKPATSEHLAEFLYAWCAENLALPAGVRVERVRVSETASTFAEFEPL